MFGLSTELITKGKLAIEFKFQTYSKIQNLAKKERLARR